MADKVTSNSRNITVNPFSKVSADDKTGVWAQDLPTLDLRYGGQWGYLPKIGGVRDGKAIHSYMYNQRYIRRDIIPVVLQTPRVFDLLPNSKAWHASYKAMWERHARVIEGLNSSLTVESGETETGLEGAKFKEPTNVTREETNVSITLDEKYGIPFEILIDTNIRYGFMDPDTKAPLLTTLPGGENIDVHTPEWWTSTILFIEPDVLQRKPIHAWLVSNLYPTSLPDIIGKKDKKAAKEMKEMTIEFGGLALPPTNVNVMNLAKTILDSLKLYTLTPDKILLPADTIASTLKSFDDMDVYYQMDNTNNKK